MLHIETFISQQSYLLPGPLMIVAENEAELEFVITSDSAKADLCFYQYLVGHLEKSLHCAKQDVLHGATNNPGHGSYSSVFVITHNTFIIALCILHT